MYIFIVNPNAGGGRGLRVWNYTKKFLNKRHEEYEVYFTAAPGDARRIYPAGRMARGCPRMM